MSYSETDIALVEKYFDAELSDSEMNQFKVRIESDETFRTLFEQEKALVGAIRYQGLQENLRYLKAVELSLRGQNQFNSNRSTNKWYFVAAAAIVGIIIIAKVTVTSFNPSPEQLFEAYFVPYPNMFEPTLRSNTPAAATRRAEAFQAYENHDYQKAAIRFKELLADHNEAGILLLLGNANLILGNIAEAKENFITLNQDFDELDMQSKWYLSLCYLKSGDVAHARKILEELGKTEISYATKARELLEKVN